MLNNYICSDIATSRYEYQVSFVLQSFFLQCLLIALEFILIELKQDHFSTRKTHARIKNYKYHITLPPV
jgi:hypothetical protein